MFRNTKTAGSPFAAVPCCSGSSRLRQSLTAACINHGFDKGIPQRKQKNETVEIGEDFARAYCEFSLGLLRDAVNSEVQTNDIQNNEEETIDAEISGEAADAAQADRTRNIMISPISVLQALEMTRIGAGSGTLEQMGMTMYPGMEPEQGRKQLLSWAEGLPSADGAEMKLANSVWINTENEQFQPDAEFLKRNALESGASVYGAPFDEAACKALNQWVEQNTDGMVKDILDRIPREAIMYLVNAAAFDAKWEKPYQSSQVGKGTFTREDGSESEVPMMYSMESVF